jgi:hypothetical protein
MGFDILLSENSNHTPSGFSRTDNFSGWKNSFPCRFHQFALKSGAETIPPTQMATTALELGSLVLHTTASRENWRSFFFCPERVSGKKLKTKDLTGSPSAVTLKSSRGRPVRFFPGEYVGSYSVCA